MPVCLFVFAFGCVCGCVRGCVCVHLYTCTSLCILVCKIEPEATPPWCNLCLKRVTSCSAWRASCASAARSPVLLHFHSKERERDACDDLAVHSGMTHCLRVCVYACHICIHIHIYIIYMYLCTYIYKYLYTCIHSEPASRALPSFKIRITSSFPAN